MKVTNFHEMGFKKKHTTRLRGLLPPEVYCKLYQVQTRPQFSFLKIQRRKNKEMFPGSFPKEGKKERKKEKELTFHNNKTHLLNLPQKCGTKLKKQNLLYHRLFCWA
jgi:hypothetical protein